MRRILFSLTLAAVLTFTAFTAQSQTLRQATIDDSGVISLPATDTPERAYQFDISDLQFASIQEAVDFFKEFNTNEAFVRPILNQGIAVLYLPDADEKSVGQWNAYFTERALPVNDVKSKETPAEPTNPNH